MAQTMQAGHLTFSDMITGMPMPTVEEATKLYDLSVKYQSLQAEKGLLDDMMSKIAAGVLGTGEFPVEDAFADMLVTELLWPQAPITQFEFKQLLQDENLIRILQSVNVDVNMLLDMSEAIYGDDVVHATGMSFEHMVDVLLSFRGGNQATVKELVDGYRAQKKLLSFHAHFKDMANDMNGMLSESSDMVKELSEALGPQGVHAMAHTFQQTSQTARAWKANEEAAVSVISNIIEEIGLPSNSGKTYLPMTSPSQEADVGQVQQSSNDENELSNFGTLARSRRNRRRGPNVNGSTRAARRKRRLREEAALAAEAAAVAEAAEAAEAAR